jgi:thiol-disulfide isomerase/thioredoxin
MRAIRWCCVLALPALFLAAGRPAAPAQDKAAGAGVEVRVVKYDGLAQAVRQMQGKVVFVDFWSTNCVPCKEKFPHVLELQRRYAGDGFAVISVAIPLDEDTPLEVERGRVLKFLQEKNAAAATNLLLDEKADVWQARLRFDGVPAVYVFNREGKWYQFTDPINYDEVDKLVAELVKAK